MFARSPIWRLRPILCANECAAADRFYRLKADGLIEAIRLLRIVRQKLELIHVRITREQHFQQRAADSAALSQKKGKPIASPE